MDREGLTHMLIGVTEPPGIFFFSEKKESKYEVTNLN
jgi:hypothetical protein